MKNSLLATPVIARAPVEVVEAYSGAWLERAELAGGQVVIVKHLPADGDWLTRVTHGLGRTHQLWHSGLLRSLETAVEHGILDVTPFDDHDVVVMDDLSDRLWPPTAPLDRRMALQALTGLGHVHRVGECLIAGDVVGDLRLCSVGARYGMFAPGFLGGDDGPNPHPFRDAIIAGWQLFDEAVDAEVAGAVAAVHADPEGFGHHLVAPCSSPVILHGDAKPENLGATNGRLTAIDWGELTGVGPREVDVAWFTVMGTRSRLDAEPDEVFALYEEASGTTLDPMILDLACIGSLAQMGFRLAGAVRLAEQPEARHKAATRLRWWTDRVRAALDRGAMP